MATLLLKYAVFFLMNITTFEQGMYFRRGIVLTKEGNIRQILLKVILHKNR